MCKCKSTVCNCKSLIMAWFTGFYQSPLSDKGDWARSYYHFNSELRP